MEPRIETLPEIKLIGQCVTMSLANSRTTALWQEFSPRRKEIKNTVNADLYSIEIYPDTKYFEQFNPSGEFEKWAAVQVTNFDSIPDKMNTLTIPEGNYAVYQYRGKPSQVMEVFKYIYGVWLPGSEYELDDRPHFALMGEKYKGESDDSEEEFWIPIKKV